MKPKTTLGAVSNVYTRLLHFKNAGDSELCKKQVRDGATLLSSGKVKVIVDENETVFTAPHMIFIRAHKAYELVALEDNTVVCSIFAVRDKTSGDIIDPNTVPAGMMPDLVNSEPFLKQD